MTALDDAGAPPALSPARTALHRVTSGVKLHFANPATVVLLPLFILGTILALNLLIWLLIVAATPVEVRSEQQFADGFSEGVQWSGAASFIFVWHLIVAIQAMNATFPYALGFGATRRDYYLGTALTWVAVAAGWAALFGVLAWIEEATVGWGLGGRMFSAVYFGLDGPWMRIVYVFLLFLLFLFLGTISGAMYVRFRSFGVTALWIGIAFLLVGVIAIIVLTQSFAQVAEFLLSIGFGGVYALTLIPTALAAVAGFFVLRRATTRN